VKHIFAAFIAIACTLFFNTANAQVNTYYATGTLIDHTTNVNGLMIRLDVGTPTNCSGNLWMIIPETNKTMMAAALLAIAMNNRANMTVYTSGNGPTGYCNVTQLDPAN
jgi:hypothetical protein